MIYSQKSEQFSVKFGPIFTQILLADEINRSPAKVQSALLEAMAERQVTIGEESYKLSSPFVVLATQNPIEQEGTYALPEAQLDRFMCKVYVNYPDFASEKSILNLKHENLGGLAQILSTDDIMSIRKAVDEVYVDDKIKDLIIKIVRATRPGSEHFPKEFAGAVNIGASPRAAIWLYKLSRYFALLDGKDFVSPEYVIKVIPHVLGHRLILSYEAIIDKMDPRDVAVKIGKKMI
jgi:MoxR-like ATPase